MGARRGPAFFSTGEVFQHIAADNYFMPALMGKETPKEIGITKDYKTAAEWEKKPLDKAAVMSELTKSFAFLKSSLTSTTAAQLDTPLEVFGQKSTTRGLWMSTATHLHEHLGQLIAYAPTNKVTPPWSKYHQVARAPAATASLTSNYQPPTSNSQLPKRGTSLSGGTHHAKAVVGVAERRIDAAAGGAAADCHCMPPRSSSARPVAHPASGPLRVAFGRGRVGVRRIPVGAPLMNVGGDAVDAERIGLPPCHRPWAVRRAAASVRNPGRESRLPRDTAARPPAARGALPFGFRWESQGLPLTGDGYHLTSVSFRHRQ